MYSFLGGKSLQPASLPPPVSTSSPRALDYRGPVKRGRTGYPSGQPKLNIWYVPYQMFSFSRQRLALRWHAVFVSVVAPLAAVGA
jgi:hypothetical protein